MADDVKCNICFVGNAGVGKTCFIQRVITQKYNENQRATVGLDYNLHTIAFQPLTTESEDITPTEKMRFCIWDTAGQDRYNAIIKSYFRNKDYIVLVYAIDDKQSFKDLNRWFEDVKSHASSKTQFILLGSKADKKRSVSLMSARTKHLQERCKFYAETSSKKDSSKYLTPLEVMKKIAQLRWHQKLCEEEREKEDLQAAQQGYATERYPQGRISLNIDEPTSSKKPCSC